MKGPSRFGGTHRPEIGTNTSLDDLSVFVAVARHASFAEASRRLSTSTSRVSRAVARLEDELGARLLRRTSRKVVPTEAGSQLLERATPHLEGLAETMGELLARSPTPSGLVRITAPAFTGSTRVATALTAFALAYPDVVVELEAANRVRDLVEDGFDLAIRVGPVQSADFVARRLWRGEFGLFATKQLLRATIGSRRRISRLELEAAPAVVSRTGATWRFRDDADTLVAVTPQVRFAVNDPRAAVAVAARGLGFAFVPREAASAELVSVACDFGAPEPLDLVLVYPTRRLLPLRVRLAIDWLLEPRWASPTTA